MTTHRLIITMLIANLVFTGGQLCLANFRAGDGDRLHRLQDDIDRLSLDNSRLQTKILSFSSLSYIEATARSLHLEPLAATAYQPASVADRSVLPVNQ